MELPEAASAADALLADLRRKGTTQRAEQEKRYLKSRRTHLGVPVPQLRIAAGVLAKKVLSREDLLLLTRRLWATEIHEGAMVAVFLLERRCALLTPGDLPFVESLLRGSGTWALVDNLAARVAGPLFASHPDLAPALDRWAGDADFWLRRAALLVHLLPLSRGEGRFDLFTRHAETLLEEKEFFIRKALGWVLRETAKKRPLLVHDWLLPRVARASPLTVREAARALPPDLAARLRAARAR